MYWEEAHMVDMCAMPFTTLQGKSEDISGPGYTCCHNHDPNSASVYVTKAKANLKSLAAQTREKPSHLFSQPFGDLPGDAKLRLGKQEDDTMYAYLKGADTHLYLTLSTSCLLTVNGLRLCKINLNPVMHTKNCHFILLCIYE